MVRKSCVQLAAAWVVANLLVAGCSSDGRDADNSVVRAAHAEGKEDAAPAKKKVYPALESGMGAVEGYVVLKGAAPKLEGIKIPADNPQQAFCVKHVKSERLLLGKKQEIKNVVLSVANYKAKRRPKRSEVVVDNKNCLFTPHVVCVTVGSSLKLSNSDNFLHNSRGVLDLQFNVAIPAGGSVVKKIRKVGQTGYGIVTCDFHPWMRADVHIFDHELFDVTGEDGKFKIVNIPPGTHELEIRHEVLSLPFAPVKKKVKIEAGKVTKLVVELEAPKG